MRIPFRIGLSGAHGLAFLEEFANFEQQLALCGVFIGSARIGWNVESNDAQSSGGLDRAHQLIEYHGRLFFTVGGGGLVSNRIDATVDTIVLDGVVDLFDGVTVIKVDRL